MKKQILFAAASAALLLASCDKEGTNTQTFTTQMMNYITEVSPTGAPTGEATIEGGLYKFGFDYNSSTVVMTAENLPSRVGISTFSTPALPATSNAIQNIVVNTKSAITPEVSVENLTIAYTPGVTPTDVTIPGVDNQQFPYGYMYPITRYTIGGDYLVRTFWPDMVFFGTTTTMFNETMSEPLTNIRYRIILKKDDKVYKATMVIYEAQFAPQMPKMNLVLEKLDVDFQPNGIVISGKDVIPQYLDGGSLLPNPNFPFDDLRFVIHGTNLTEGRAEFSVAGRFVGSFNGTYIQLDAEKK